MPTEEEFAALKAAKKAAKLAKKRKSSDTAATPVAKTELPAAQAEAIDPASLTPSVVVILAEAEDVGDRTHLGKLEEVARDHLQHHRAPCRVHRRRKFLVRARAEPRLLLDVAKVLRTSATSRYS